MTVTQRLRQEKLLHRLGPHRKKQLHNKREHKGHYQQLVPSPRRKLHLSQVSLLPSIVINQNTPLSSPNKNTQLLKIPQKNLLHKLKFHQEIKHQEKNRLRLPMITLLLIFVMLKLLHQRDLKRQGTENFIL